MNTQYAMVLTLLAGVAMGAGAVQGLHAQAKPPTYVVTETDITDMNSYAKDYVPLVQTSIRAAGGAIVAAGQNITVFEGAPPKSRVAISRFDSLEQVKAWRNSTQYKEARKIGDKYATYRSFAIEGVAQ
jgi:uncharacterized protein (DUF1330 family)